MSNILVKQFEGTTHFETKQYHFESNVTYNARAYYKMFFEQKIEEEGIIVDNNYYVRGWANIDGKVFISYYKSMRSEEIKVAYSVQDHQRNLRAIDELARSEY